MSAGTSTSPCASDKCTRAASHTARPNTLSRALIVFACCSVWLPALRNVPLSCARCCVPERIDSGVDLLSLTRALCRPILTSSSPSIPPSPPPTVPCAALYDASPGFCVDELLVCDRNAHTAPPWPQREGPPPQQHPRSRRPLQARRQGPSEQVGRAAARRPCRCRRGRPPRRVQRCPTRIMVGQHGGPPCFAARAGEHPDDAPLQHHALPPRLRLAALGEGEGAGCGRRPARARPARRRRK